MTEGERAGELDWDAVVQVHGGITGIGQRDRRATSLLCNQQKSGRYPDRIDQGRLTYFVAQRTLKADVRALFVAVEERSPVRVFEKLAPNRWLDRGLWVGVAIGESEDGDHVPITFVPVEGAALD